MGVILDILGSTFIGGLILFLIMNLNLFMSNAGYSSDNELRMQQNAKTLAEILNYDLRKIGYNYDGTAILTAEKERVKFLGDLQKPGEAGFGVVDTVEYSIKDSTFALGTSNCRDIILIRRLNNEDYADGPSLGLVKLNFSYLDSLSAETADLSKIKYIKTELWVEPIDPNDNFISGKKEPVFTYWEFTINPRNI
jgi:hypothetical protein